MLLTGTPENVGQCFSTGVPRNRKVPNNMWGSMSFTGSVRVTDVRDGGATVPSKFLIWWKSGQNLWKFWQNLCKRSQNRCRPVLWFYKNGTENQGADVFLFWRSCFYFVLFGQVRGDLGKFNNGAWIVLWFLNKCTQHEKKCSGFFWRSLEFFSGKFREILGKNLRTPKNLHAPTPMVRVPHF